MVALQWSLLGLLVNLLNLFTSYARSGRVRFVKYIKLPNILEYLIWDIVSPSFLGLTRYYRNFVKGHEVIAKHLTTMLKKWRFKWNPQAKEAFQQLKQAMTTTVVLQLSNFRKAFILVTDASYGRIGAVLMQDEHPHCIIQ